MIAVERMSAGNQHEQKVFAALVEVGWTVGLFGQALLSKDLRLALRAVSRSMPVRWLPDFIAVRGNDAIFVDAKCHLSETPNHSIEVDSFESHDLLIGSMLMPVYYVFPDGGTIENQQARPFLIGPIDGSNNGSGTRFYLLRKSRCEAFRDVFQERAA